MGVKTICAVGSDEKAEYVKSLGADEIIRYDWQKKTIIILHKRKKCSEISRIGVRG